MSQAKSWYKHLPPVTPGAPFYFFLDPCAGLDRVRLSEERAAFFERTEKTKPFHYTWMTTKEYRARFGCLSFSCEQASELFRPVSVPLTDGTEVPGFLDNNPAHPIIYTKPDQAFRIPHRVLEAGRADVTGVVHSLAATVWFWRGVLSAGKEELTWPEGTGGPSTIERIRERCHVVGDDSQTSDLNAADPEIEALLRPERKRLETEMISAVRRVRHLIFEGA